MRFAYEQVECVCGRKLGVNVVRQHRRRCEVQLEVWRRQGVSVVAIDERDVEQRGQLPMLHGREEEARS